MKRYAFLFPGQGSQYPGMGKDFSERFAIARETFEEADDLLKEKLSSIVFYGPESELVKTHYSQAGIFVLSVALLRVLQSQFPDLKPSICSGLSLGEYTALWASGRLGFRETLLLVKERARGMSEACEKTEGAMAAVLGMSGAEAEKAIRSIPGVWIANYNCPGQVVISGTKRGVEAGGEALKAAGAKRVIPLQVHGAFHSELMASAEERLIPFIQAAPIRDSGVEFVMNVPGAFVTSIEEIKKNLAAQVTHSVRWEQGIGAIEQKKPDLYIEVGCGKTLSGLNKKIAVAAPSLSIEKIGDLELAAKTIEALSCSC